MKMKKEEILLSFLFLFLLGYLLYLVFYKPVEGFFAKTDACDMANRNKTFIQNQVTDVSNNLLNLQNGIQRASGIRRELQDLLYTNNCLILATSDTCATLNATFTNTSTQLKNALAEKKISDEKIASLNSQIATLTTDINALNTTITNLTSYFTQYNLSCTVATTAGNYAGAQACTGLQRIQTDLPIKISDRTNLTTQLTAETTNNTRLQTNITSLDTTLKNTQDQLDTNACISYKSTFLCNQISSQYRVLDRTFQNSKADLIEYTNFYTAKSSPLADINALITNAC
jgi:hypothetical protein